MFRTKLAIVTAAILCSAIAQAGSITTGGGTANSSSASNSGGVAGSFTMGSGVFG